MLGSRHAASPPDPDSSEGDSRDTTPSSSDSPLSDPTPVGGAVERQRKPTAPPFAPGTALAGRYRIVRFIAAGGMGEVYEAEDVMLGTTVALKRIRPDAAAGDRVHRRFHREILLARRVTHPNVCRIFDLGHHRSPDSGAEETFLTMELLGGETLRRRLQRRGRQGPGEALPLITQMAAALVAAHDAGVVHRDFKPANVMLVPVRRRGAPPRVVVTDFGLAWAGGGDLESISQSNQFVGTPAYVAPEQVEGGEVTAATDIYAFGVVLYEMVTGQLPFVGDSPMSTVLQRLRSGPASPRLYAPELAAHWEEVILRCLEREPHDRYPSADHVVKALGAERLEARPRAGSHRRLLLATGVSVLALTAAGPFIRTRWIAPATISPVHFPAATARRAVAVLGFKNLSGDERHGWLSTALSEMLTAELGAGAGVRTIPGENVARMKSDLSLDAAESLGAETLARIRSHVGADTVLLGSYVAVGEGVSARLRLDLRLQDAASGETVASITETGTEGDLFEVVSRAGHELREKLDVAQLSRDEAVSLRASLPSNPDGARLYAEGLGRLRNFDALGARSLLEQATRVDPHYAPAQAALGEAWAALGYEAKAAEAARRAYDGAAGLSSEERLSIEGRLREATREWPKAIDIYRSLWTFFPDNLEHGLRLANAQITAGQAREARDTVTALRRLEAPASEDPRIGLTDALASEALGDFKSERKQAARAAAQASARGASLVTARARLAEALALRYLGEPRDAIAAATTARRIYEAAGDRGGVALALLFLSNALQVQGDLAAARRAAEEGLAIRRETGDRRGAARLLNRLGSVLEVQGDMAAARRRREEALALFREVGDRYGAALATFNLANVQANVGDHEGAQSTYESALAAFREIGNKMGVAAALTGVADEMKKRGDFTGAGRHYEEVLSLDRETGNVEGQAVCRANLGIMAALRADLDEAQRQYEDGLRLAQGAENKNLVAVALTGLGEVQLRRGDLAGARRRFEEGLAIRTAIGQERTMAESRMLLATLALEDGRIKDAVAESRAAETAFRKVGAPEEQAQARAILARALLAAGEDAAARTELRFARTLVGRVTSPDVQFTLAIAEGRAQAAAGDAKGAIEGLEATAARARDAGLKAYELEARLALGVAEMRLGRAESGRARLQAVEREARANGLGLLARQATMPAR